MGNLSQSICLKHFQNILITPLGISKVGFSLTKITPLHVKRLFGL